ncbi:MAG: hypothetical protein KDA93_09520 [Planctomycetaceae bacterium]|nr:hypothetical protein [Planctomycetaceae bacterium]
MTTFNRIAIASLLSFSMTAVASANEPLQPLPRPTFAGGVVAPVIGGYGHLRTGGVASTAHESFLRGRADVIRANGEYQLLVAEALRSFEAARSHRIDNDVKQIAARQEIRRMWRAEQHRIHEEARARRDAYRSLYRATMEAQVELTSVESNPDTLAQSKLRSAMNLLNAGQVESGIKGLVEITQNHVDTVAAEEAAKILTEIKG